MITLFCLKDKHYYINLLFIIRCMQENTILKFRNGDIKAYRALFIKLYPVMCLFSKKIIQSYDDAEDIVQEVFIELWNQRQRFESIEQIKAFLYLSVKNRCLNFLKHLKVKEKFVGTTLAADGQFFEEHILESEVIQNIYNAVNDLPEQRKQIIILSMQGLKNNEIAEDMQVSVNTVKLQKKIAYKQLREKLKPSLYISFFIF
jgi:RNA polymerase sigma-70 factor (family 1)